MPTQRQIEASQLYAGLMEEAKVRFACIDTAINGGLPLPGQAIQEFGFLQLRLLCELIALGCLVAHGDIKATQSRDLQKAYAADKIIERLDALHPNFFPRPVRVHLLPPSNEFPTGRVHLEDRLSGFLTKAELIRLYGKTGDHLHRGTVRKLLSHRNPTQINFPEIATWTNKIIALLDNHHIASFDNKLHFVCVLKNAGNGDRVQVAIGEAP